jgi:SOS-response transcriptional repressor LexA
VVTRPYQRHAAADVLAAIIAYKRAHDGRSPAVREIGAACGITSTSVIHRLLRELASEGRIRIPGGVNRGIEVAGGAWVHADHAARFPPPRREGAP